MKRIKILVLVLLVFSLAFLFGCNKSDNQGTSSTKDISDAKTDTGSEGKIKDFLEKGGSYRCEYVITTKEGTGKQVVYLDGQNMRTELSTSKEPGMIILVGKIEGAKECSYMWSEGVPPTETDPGNKVLKACTPTKKDSDLSGSLRFSSINLNAKANCVPYEGVVNTNPPIGYQISEMDIPTESELN